MRTSTNAKGMYRVLFHTFVPNLAQYSSNEMIIFTIAMFFLCTLAGIHYIIYKWFRWPLLGLQPGVLKGHNYFDMFMHTKVKGRTRDATGHMFEEIIYLYLIPE